MCTLKGEQLAKGSSRAFCPNSYLAEGKPPDFAGDASEALALRQRGNLLFRRVLNDSNNFTNKSKNRNPPEQSSWSKEGWETQVSITLLACPQGLFAFSDILWAELVTAVGSPELWLIRPE